MPTKAELVLLSPETWPTLADEEDKWPGQVSNSLRASCAKSPRGAHADRQDRSCTDRAH